MRIAPRPGLGFWFRSPNGRSATRRCSICIGPDVPGQTRGALDELIWTGLFTYPDTQRRARDASAGQYRKLQLARLLAAQPNTLLLDEPTNHFSLQVIERLEAAIGVSRPRRRRVARSALREVPSGGVTWRLEGGRLAREL